LDCGGIAAALVGRRKLVAQAAVQANHPDSPWLWRSDWASGRIVDSSRTVVFTAWSFAALWNLISFPTAFLAVREAIQEGKPAAFLAVLFPLVGTGLVVWAVRATLRYRKYGVSRLELSGVPAVIGRSLTGMVRAPASIRPEAGFDVSLTCIRRVTRGGGKNRSISESIVWQEERRVAGEPRRTAAAMETHIPIAFRLPADAIPCDDTDSNNRVVWRLQLSASVPGVAFSTRTSARATSFRRRSRPDGVEESRVTPRLLALR
jgi:hypothetical protein